MKWIKPSEKEIQNSIIEYLLLKGHCVWRNNTGMVVSEYKGRKRIWRAGVKGSSDILGICKTDGKFIAIEVKKPGKRATFHQRHFLKRIRECGGYTFIAYDLKDIQKIL